MKEIKAYVRAAMAIHVAQALAEEPDLHFSVLDAKGISPGLSAGDSEYSVALGEPFERIVKIEVICRDESAARIAELIRRAANTGRRGDGMVFIASVEEAIRISTGERGPESLPE